MINESFSEECMSSKYEAHDDIEGNAADHSTSAVGCSQATSSSSSSTSYTAGVSKTAAIQSSTAPAPPANSSKGEASASASTAHSHSQSSRSQHLGANRQYWRDIILGVNDGLVSTFLLVAGVAGGGLSSTDILLTAMAGAIAGAISMCVGEYVATKSQNEVLEGEIALEKEHVKHHTEDELSELSGLLEIIGIPKEEEELTNHLLTYYRSNPEALLKIMVSLEFGVLEDEARSPLRAGLTSCGLFLLGALPSVVPYMFVDIDPFSGLIIAAGATTAALLLVGGIKTWATRGNWYQAAAENLAIAGVGGAVAYVVGVGFDHILHHT